MQMPAPRWGGAGISVVRQPTTILRIGPAATTRPINNANANRIESYEHTKSHAGELMGAAGAAVMKTLVRHAEEQAAKGKKDAAE